MTTPPELLCGIDIGSDYVRAALARAPEPPEGRSGDAAGAAFGESSGDASADETADPQLEVLAVGQAESRNSIQVGDVVRPTGVTEAVRQAVEEVEQTAGVEVGSACVSVGGRSRRSLNSAGIITIPDRRRLIEAEDVHRAVMSAVPREGGPSWLRPLEEILHVLPQEFWVDGLDSTSDPTGWTGEQIETRVHLVKSPRSALDRIEESVNKAGIHIERLVAAPLAAGYGVLDYEQRQAGALVLDIGAMTTEIALFRRGALWGSDLMPSGGRRYTHDLASALQCSHARAERAKREHGVALVDKVPAGEYFELQVSGGGYPKQWPRRQLAEVLQARAAHDLTKIRDRMRQADRDLPGSIVLTGGGANLEGLAEVARLVFGIPAQDRAPVGLAGLRDRAGCPQFAGAVGLCRYGLIRRRRDRVQRTGIPFSRMGRAIGAGLRRVAGQLRKAR